MKKRIVALIFACVMILALTACGSNKPDPSSLGELETTRSESNPQQTGDQQTASPSSTTRQNVLYEETTENGLAITVFSDGSLLLENADVEENLKNRNVFSDYVANIKTVKLGSGVTRIGEKSFQNWDKLQNVIMGEDVLEVAYSAFSGCVELADVSFGKNVQKVGEYAFTGCTKLKDAVLSDSVTTVGDYAFSKCTALQNATFGKNVSYMGNMVFEGCTAFTYFKTGSDITAHSFEANTTIVTLHMEDTVKVIGERAFSGCTALNFITWPAGLVEIKDYAFAGCTKLNTVDIKSCSEGMKISDGAFSKCTGLISVSLPEGATDFGDRSFEECENLNKIVLPSTTKNLGTKMLYKDQKLTAMCYRGSQDDWNWRQNIKKSSNWAEAAGKTSPTKFDYKD